MRSIIETAKSAIVTTSVAVLLVGGIGCGDSARNDQGVSFTFLGWFDVIQQQGGAQQGQLQLLPVSTAATPLSGSITGSDETEITAFSGFASQPVFYAGLKNGLTGQFIRAERMFHSYYVPGASVNPPDTSIAIPGTLFPASDGIDQIPSTLPGSFDLDSAEIDESAEQAIGDYLFTGASLIPSPVREFMVLNKSQFPEPPFVLTVTSYAEGVTSAGQRLQSNEVQFEVLIEPDVLIEPTFGSAGDTGAEATLESEEGSLSASSEEVFE